MTKIYLAKYSCDDKSAAAKRLLATALLAFGKPDCLDAEILKAKNGKPYFSGGGLFFNISHSAGFVACVLSGEEVGIDVEEPRQNLLRLKKRILQKEELCLTDGMDETCQIRFLTARWVLLESFFKYSGEGIGKLFSGLPKLERQSENLFCVPGSGVFLHLFETDNYFLSVASASEMRPQLEILDTI